MQSRVPGVLGIAILTLSGCARNPAPQTPDPAEQAHIQEIRAAVMDRPSIPGARKMLPDVELVTFPVRRGAGTARDTIRGAAPVASWLDRLASQTAGTPSPFQLEAREVVVCEGAAVEQGRYRLPDANMLAYVALWRPAGGGWRLAGLWLSPPSSVRPGSLARGCVTDALASTLHLGVTLGYGSGPGMGEVADQLRTEGYGEQSGGEGTRPWLNLWAGWDATPRVAVKIGYGRTATRLETAAGTAYTRNIDVGIHVLGLTAEMPLGPVWVEVGPAVAIVKADFVSAIVTRNVVLRRDASDAILRPGAVARVAYRRVLSSNINGLAALEYSYFPPAELAETLPGVSVGVTGLGLVLGLEWLP